MAEKVRDGQILAQCVNSRCQDYGVPKAITLRRLAPGVVEMVKPVCEQCLTPDVFAEMEVLDWPERETAQNFAGYGRKRPGLLDGRNE
jgi:hypothetical protein